MVLGLRRLENIRDGYASDLYMDGENGVRVATFNNFSVCDADVALLYTYDD